MSDRADEIARETMDKLTVPGCVADVAIIAAALRSYGAECRDEGYSSGLRDAASKVQLYSHVGHT